MAKKSLILLACIMSCHQQPKISPAVDNLSPLLSPPMGATTYNDELKKELNLLEKILEGGLKAELEPIKQALMYGTGHKLFSQRNTQKYYLARLLLSLPELVHKQKFTALEKNWLVPKFLFIKHRYPESALKLAKLLEKNPDFHEARNWFARAIFILGNPDKAILELKYIIKSTPEKSLDHLEALYLLGAFVLQSGTQDKQKIGIGINSWEKFLKLKSQDKKLSNAVLDGLSELKNRLKNNKTKQNNNFLDPLKPSKKYSQEKNKILEIFAQEKLLQAEQLIHNFLKSKKDPDIKTILARIKIKSGQIEEAVKLFANIVNINPNYAPGYHYQGMSFMLLGQPEKAVKSWQKVVKLNTKYAQNFNLKQRISIAQRMIGTQEKPNIKIESH